MGWVSTEKEHHLLCLFPRPSPMIPEVDSHTSGRIQQERHPHTAHVRSESVVCESPLLSLSLSFPIAVCQRKASLHLPPPQKALQSTLSLARLSPRLYDNGGHKFGSQTRFPHFHSHRAMLILNNLWVEAPSSKRAS